ncbi:Zinc/iron permease [Forsythia ovata]|uniref:Zinc/iron permease n=1 Tax=Forsythia ovata TaxID=205694 RepID=A0ABD1W542_9LAMI
MASLATLMADFLGTQYYERKQENESPNVGFDSSDMVFELGIVPVEKKRESAKVFGEDEWGAIHIVGMRAHVAHHRHNHLQEDGACEWSFTFTSDWWWGQGMWSQARHCFTDGGNGGAVLSIVVIWCDGNADGGNGDRWCKSTRCCGA